MVVEAKTSRAGKTAKDQPKRKSPVANISNIGSLKRYPDREAALDILHDVAKACAPIIHHYNFKVGTLSEMFPKSPNLLGLNVNRGQKILIRLRMPFNERSFLPMSELIGTFLHELTHNVHGPHDGKFYKLLDELREKYESGFLGAMSSSYICEEGRLGTSRLPSSQHLLERQKRLNAVTKPTYKSEKRRLGGAAQAGKDRRTAMFEAAQRRLLDSKWCGGNITQADIDNLTDNDDKMKDVKEVIDLTDDSFTEGASTRDAKNNHETSDHDVIVID